MPTVIIFGFGKIGALKAAIWKRVGVRTIIVDPSQVRIAAAKKQDFEAFPSVLDIDPARLRAINLVDVSVPSGYHAAVLRIALGALPNCTVALVEKPLVSSGEELIQLQDIMAHHPNVRLVVNESYYASEGLKLLKAYMQNKSADIGSVAVTFTKNRLPDIRLGRFVDEQLGPYGIEVPHMLACLKYLGFGEVGVASNHWYTDVHGQEGSEGIVCELFAGNVPILFVEVLGPFGVNQQTLELLPDPEAPITRNILVSFTDGTEARLDFDPVPGINRYYSSLTTPEGRDIIEDDHLFSMLSSVAHFGDGTYRNDDAIELASFTEAVKDNERLMRLHKQATIKNSFTGTRIPTS